MRNSTDQFFEDVAQIKTTLSAYETTVRIARRLAPEEFNKGFDFDVDMINKARQSLIRLGVNFENKEFCSASSGVEQISD